MSILRTRMIDVLEGKGTISCPASTLTTIASIRLFPDQMHVFRMAIKLANVVQAAGITSRIYHSGNNGEVYSLVSQTVTGANGWHYIDHFAHRTYNGSSVDVVEPLYPAVRISINCQGGDSCDVEKLFIQRQRVEGK